MASSTSEGISASLPPTTEPRRTRADSAAQRSMLPVGAFDHCDTLLLWTVCRDTIGYARGRAIPVTAVSYREVARMVGLSVNSLYRRARRLESVGLVRCTPKGLSSTLREGDVKWPKVESD